SQLPWPVLGHEVAERLAERFRILGHTALCEAVTELVQHLGNRHDGVLVIVTDLAVEREPRLRVRAGDCSLIPVGPQPDSYLDRLIWRSSMNKGASAGREIDGKSRPESIAQHVGNPAYPPPQATFAWSSGRLSSVSRDW